MKIVCEIEDLSPSLSTGLGVRSFCRYSGAIVDKHNYLELNPGNNWKPVQLLSGVY